MGPDLQIVNITQDWIDCFRSWHLNFFVIPVAIVTLATFAANFILLTCIYLSRVLSRETRYLLLANTLIADILFLIFNLARELCNATGVPMPWIACELCSAVIATAYSSALLSITLMVADTFAAVRWPLKYRELFPPARTHLILLGIWLLAATYPLILVVMMADSYFEAVNMCLSRILHGVMTENPVGNHLYFIIGAIVCALLISYCYIRLYMVTKTQGIWQSRFSRARVTLLVHGVLLFLYFAPGFVYNTEIMLFHRKDISLDMKVWISAINASVFMLLPRACAPYMYGLRYREIQETLMQLLLNRSSARS